MLWGALIFFLFLMLDCLGEGSHFLFFSVGLPVEGSLCFYSDSVRLPGGALIRFSFFPVGPPVGEVKFLKRNYFKALGEI